MLKPQGHAVIFGDGATVERDTFQCKHCQRVVFVQPRAAASDSGGWCRRCMAPVCGPCADSGKCEPWEKQLEEIEKKARQAEQRDRLLAAVTG